LPTDFQELSFTSPQATLIAAALHDQNQQMQNACGSELTQALD
jgi:hypothetical protein